MYMVLFRLGIGLTDFKGTKWRIIILLLVSVEATVVQSIVNVPNYSHFQRTFIVPNDTKVCSAFKDPDYYDEVLDRARSEEKGKVSLAR